MLPIVDAEQNAIRGGGQGSEILEVRDAQAQRLLHDHVGAGFKRGPGRGGVINGRTRDVQEVGRLAVEQQLEVLVNADVLDRAQGRLTARCDRLVNRNDFDAGPPAPSNQMAMLGDLAEA